MTESQIRKKADRSMLVAIIFYATTIAIGLGGAVKAAYGYTLDALIMGAFAFVAAVLCVMAFRAARRWSALIV
jgi:nitrogen fixation protein FixH